MTEGVGAGGFKETARSLAAFNVISRYTVDRDIFLWSVEAENFINENEKSPFMNLPVLVWISPELERENEKLQKWRRMRLKLFLLRKACQLPPSREGGIGYMMW